MTYLPAAPRRLFFLLPRLRDLVILQLQNQSELRAPTPERAAWFLDAAIAARHSSQRPSTSEEEHRNSHMLFTLHIYQYRMEKTGKGGSKCCSLHHRSDSGVFDL